MKRIIVLLGVAMTMLGFIACGNSDNTKKENINEVGTENDAALVDVEEQFILLENMTKTMQDAVADETLDDNEIKLINQMFKRTEDLLIAREKLGEEKYKEIKKAQKEYLDKNFEKLDKAYKEYYDAMTSLMGCKGIEELDIVNVHTN